MDAERFIEAVKRRQVERALESLLHPQAEGSFHYGVACGFTQGLEEALNILAELQEEADERATGRKALLKNNPYMSDFLGPNEIE